MKRTRPARPPQSAGILGAFRTNKRPIPWRRAIISGVSLGLPILVGSVTGRLSYGLIACFGGFTFLYASNEPYSKRAVKLFVVLLVLAISLGAGALGASISVGAAAVVLGCLGFGIVFACEVLGVPEPGPFFFLFAAAVGTSMPGTPSAILLRIGLIILGGIPAWLIAMAGWIWDPHGPETAAVGDAYRGLASLLAALGTERLHAAQHEATLRLRSAEEVLAPGRAGLRLPGAYHRLLHLGEQADAIFLAIIALSGESDEPVDPKLPAAVRALADAVDDPDRAASLIIPERAGGATAMAHLVRELKTAVVIATDERPAPMPVLAERRRTIRGVLSGALDRRSAVLPRALRIGVLLAVAHLAAHLLGAHSPYWVVLSCAGVVLGPTVLATLHRAIQRVIGTVIGAFLGALILALHPSGIWIALNLMGLQTLSQLYIRQSYALGIAFATPLAFIMVEAGHPNLSVQYLVTARLSDIVLGGLLGLGGTLLLGGRTASRRLHAVLSEVIRAEGRIIATVLADPQREDRAARDRLERALITLRIVYDGALNELSNDRSRVEALWPAVVAAQRLGPLLIALSDQRRRGRIATESLSPLAGLFDPMADAVMDGRAPRLERTPVIPEYPVLSEELRVLVVGLQVLQLGSLPSKSNE